jgi:hypothetical protein
MNGWPELDGFLRTDPRDAGCGKAMELLHVYAELAAADPRGAKDRYPEVATHLRACGPCEEDLAGLLAAIRVDLTEGSHGILNRPESRWRAQSTAVRSGYGP